MNYTLGFAEGIAELACEPAFTYEDGESALTEVIEASWRPDMRALLILDEGSAFSPTRDGLQTLAGLMDAILSNEEVLIAIVVAKVVHYGIGRVLEARVGRGTGRVRVFLKEEAARQWLAKPPSGSEG
jgi:hypothetical protein